MTVTDSPQNAPDALPAANALQTPRGTVCASCGTMFGPKRSWQRFCSGPCRRDFHRLHGTVSGAHRRIEALEAEIKSLQAAVRGLVSAIARGSK